MFLSQAFRAQIGWIDVAPSEEGRADPLLSGFGEREAIFQWHGDTFDVPDDAVHLASSETCANQAFRFGDRVYGLQFHLEVDEPLVECWLGVPHNRREIEQMNGKTSLEKIRCDTARHVARGRELSDLCFSEFIRLFGNAEAARPAPARLRSSRPVRELDRPGHARPAKP